LNQPNLVRFTTDQPPEVVGIAPISFAVHSFRIVLIRCFGARIRNNREFFLGLMPVFGKLHPTKLTSHGLWKKVE
jgi:hypothetical protein